MVKQEFIIASNCRIDGKHVAKGTRLELDMDIPREADLVAILNRAGRIGLATKKNIDAINEEIRADAEADRLAKEQAKRSPTDMAESIRQLAMALVGKQRQNAAA